MRRTGVSRHLGSSSSSCCCNPIPSLVLYSLLLFITIGNRNLFLKTTMAWTIHRSFHQLASRLQLSSSSSVFLLSRPTRTAAILFGRDSNHGITRSNGHRHNSRSTIGSRTMSSASPTRLHSYQDFLKQEEHDNILVSYFTDIEGDKFYLDRYVDNSKILTWITNDRKERDESSTPELSLYSSKDYPPVSFPYDRRIDFCHPNSMLVFGGDLWDKGGFDLYVTRQLLDLKRRYPDRVVWVLGNRDINKLRIPQELGLPDPTTSMSSTSSSSSSTTTRTTKASTASTTTVPYHPGLIWFRGSDRVGDPDGNLPSMDPGERLRWLLGNTMGSPDAMEHRRQELFWEEKGCREDNSRSIKGEEAETAISDIDVVRSYQESCHPRGEMGRFLSEGLLAAKVGPILFVHGSLPLTKDTMAEAKEDKSKTSIWDDLTFCMPWINKTHHDYAEDHKFPTASDFGVETIEDWLETVNAFGLKNVEAWKHHIAQIDHDYKSNKEKGQIDEDVNDRYKKNSKNAVWAYRAGYGNGPSYSGIYYSDLVQYGMGMIPGGKKNPTVVYNSFTPEGMPTFFLPPEEQNDGDDKDGNLSSGSYGSSDSDVAISTRDFFEQSTIQLILTGHKPQGDMPSPIRVDQSSWVICADTSYSGDTKWFHDDFNVTTPEKMERRRQLQERRRSNLGRGNSISFRGETAVSEVLVKLSKGASSLESIRYHGVLSDGTEYESVDLLAADGADCEGFDRNYEKYTTSIGSMGEVAPISMVPDPSESPHEGRWWTKGICRDGSRLYYAGEGYNVWNYIVSPDVNESDGIAIDGTENSNK